jgi:secreted Zn-dependent insulinase-like peptidase
MKPATFKVNTLEEFQEMVDKKDFSISKAVVDSILGNLKSRKKNVHMLSVKCIEENTVFDITLEKVAFADTLKQNLAHFEKHEMFEECVKINEAIVQLSKSK